jgi:hypothetical protein
MDGWIAACIHTHNIPPPTFALKNKEPADLEPRPSSCQQSAELARNELEPVSEASEHDEAEVLLLHQRYSGYIQAYNTKANEFDYYRITIFLDSSLAFLLNPAITLQIICFIMIYLCIRA